MVAGRQDHRDRRRLQYRRATYVHRRNRRGRRGRDRSRRSDGRRSVAFHGRADGTPKGRGLIFSAIERGATQAQIWFLPYPKGAAQKITNDLNDYRDLSLTDDSTALITVQAETLVNVWLSPNA